MTRKIFALFAAIVGLLTLGYSANAQVLLSGGLTYSQNFDSLASTTTTTTVPWTDNVTLLGWYGSRAVGGPAYTSYRVSGGESTSGWIYSWGTNGVGALSDRAFGSLSSGTPVTNAIGVRFQNNTANSIGDVTISFAGEWWRNGGNVSLTNNTFYFAYRVGAGLTDLTPGNESGWTPFSSLSYSTPTPGSSTAGPIDGNAPGNRTLFNSILLTGVTLAPGQELVLRWYDINESGNDMGMGLDDMTVNFSIVPEPSVCALLGLAGLLLHRRKRN
jgi:hypothetical protein